MPTERTRLFSGVERTRSGENQTSVSECRLLGEGRTSIGTSRTSLLSHKPTWTGQVVRRHLTGANQLFPQAYAGH